MKIKIYAKCADLFSATLVDDKGYCKDYSGYVPNFFPGDHYGDYVMLDIDVATGQITNWRKPSANQLNTTFGA